MKTLTQVIKENPQYTKLIRAVVKRIGIDSIADVNVHGIDGGFNGFIYYAETHKFAMYYRKSIINMLEETADALGEDVVAMVSNFGVFRNAGMDKDDRKDLHRYLGEAKVEQGTVTNLMAWYAAEGVCQLFEN